METLIFVGFIFIVLFATPWAAIWALNTLFTLGIAYTFNSWLSALILCSIISPTVNVKKN